MTTADDDPALKGRGYVPDYTVRYRGSQRAEHRFGPGRRAEIREMLRSQDEGQDPVDFTGRWDGFPRVSRARMNLTALSQHYDLYFVAYRGHIYVYRLNRGVKVALGEPEVILDPRNHESPMAEHVEGHINPSCPQEINHVVVGELGDEEIFLVGRDNGEVVAWYTGTIAQYLETTLRAKERPQRNIERPGYASQRLYPRHFFADNVGISAWGLAIHKESRLIAVSSNAHEITVFAFAMNRKGEAANQPAEDGNDDDVPEPIPTDGKETVDTTPSQFDKREIEMLKGTMFIPVLEEDGWQLPMYPWESESNWAADFPEFKKEGRRASPDRALITEEAQAQVAKLQRRFQTRQRSWRIVLSLGMEASNIPSIAFCEDAEGNANRVAAIDINGYLYIVDIWQIGRKPIRIPPHNVQTPSGRRHMQVRGWNVLPVMDSQLLQTDTVHAAIGLHPKKAVHRAKTSRGTWLDISKCMPEVPYDAASKLHRHRIANFRSSDVSGERDGLTPGSAPGEGDAIAALTAPVLLASQVMHPVHDPDDGVEPGAGPVRLGMTMVPYSGAHYAAFPSPKALVDFSGASAAAHRAQRLRLALTQALLRKKARLWGAEDLLRDVSFLRFNEHDVEMLTLDESGCGVVCHHVLENWNAHNQPVHWDMHFGQRCSMLLRIPELNLVIMGSMCGRVALLTLTKPPQPEAALTSTPADRRAEVAAEPRRAFRVDAVLPFEAEERSKERPFVCLLGIAVSPAPEARSHGLELRRRGKGRRRQLPVPWDDDEGAARLEPEPGPEPELEAPRRWRLLLNYQDHTVLQYEIIRREEGEKPSWGGFTGPMVYGNRDFRVMGVDEEDGESEDGEGSDESDSELGTDLTEAEHLGEEDEIVGAVGGVHGVEVDSDDDFPDMQIG